MSVLKTFLELVLIPFAVGVAAEVVADWLIQYIKDKSDKNSLSSFRAKRKAVAGTTAFLRFAIRFLEL